MCAQAQSSVCKTNYKSSHLKLEFITFNVNLKKKKKKKVDLTVNLNFLT